MLAIYQKHNPDKVAGIDEALDKYEGRWGVMLQASMFVNGGVLACVPLLVQKISFAFPRSKLPSAYFRILEMRRSGLHFFYRIEMYFSC